MSDALVHTMAAMGTVVSVHIVGHGRSQRARRGRAQAMGRALEWFRHVESICSRFDAASEVRQLSAHVGTAVSVSALLFEAVQFAVAVAEETDGAFDPTVGAHMEHRGFDRDYRTNAQVRSLDDAPLDVSYRDITLDASARTITLHRKLLIDLGAIAKGLAIDMAARELTPLENFAVNAGGDLFLGGRNEHAAPWTVGIKHPRDATQLLETLVVSDSAVCTSGDYERVAPHHVGAAPEHHLMDPRTGQSARAVASVTVVAPSAMVADALGTAAFVLGPVDGMALLSRHGVHGVMITRSLERFATT